jgi:hypothetical protein
MANQLAEICAAGSQVQVQMLSLYPSSTDPKTWQGTQPVTATIRVLRNVLPSGLFIEISALIEFGDGGNAYVAHGVTYEGQCLFLGPLDVWQNVYGPSQATVTIRAQINPVQT